MFVPMDYNEAHEFVRVPGRSKRNVHWEGWDMVFFTPFPGAHKMENGAFYLGRWGVQTRVSVLDDGTWEVPGQYVNSTRRTRTRR